MKRYVSNQTGFVSFLLASLLMVVALSLWASAAVADEPKLEEYTAVVEPALLAEIEANGKASYLVYLKETADLSPAVNMDWEAQGWFVYNTLREVAQRSQADIVSLLKNDDVEYKTFFIANAIQVTSGVETLNSLAAHPSVASIEASKTYAVPEPERISPNSPLAIEWGVSIIRADEVWNDLGVFGAGIVVASIDTGVQYDHPALQGKYRGTHTGSHDFNFFDPSNTCGGVVCDNNNHGTHVTGSMLGDDGGANQIGVAPEAIWIAAKGCEANSCSDASLLSSAEWMLAPCGFGDVPGDPSCNPNMRPHVLNNSWGGGGGNSWYQASVDAWRAVSIIPVFSAGNSGPGTGTIGSPSDYCNVMSIGGTNISDGMYPSSSRGPGAFAGCTDKPDISAPGQGVRSSVAGSGYATFSGTSMASPHVSGCIALMMSVAPNLDYDQIYTILTTTAEDLGAPGFDYNYGNGRIDCYEAVLEAQILAGPTGTIEGTVTADGSGDPLAGVSVVATLNVTTTKNATTNGAGEYTMTFSPEGTYTMTASVFGYLPQTISGVQVISGSVTTRDFVLEQAPSHTVSGVVTDATTGWPLYASIEIGGADIDPIWTDPVNGSYSILLPEGMTYTFAVNAWVAGYETAMREVGPLTSDQTEDFGLDVDAVACIAPGYVVSGGFLENFNSGALPAGWAVIDNLGGGHDWRFNNPGNRANLTGGTDGFAIVDSDFYGSGNSQDTELWTPSLDMSGQASVTLEFKYDFRWWSGGGDEVANVDVSIDGGTIWTNVWTRSGASDRGPKTAVVDISAIAANEADVIVRFHYFDATFDYWWQVDDVKIGNIICTPEAGGLLVGQVYDGNTAATLTGAMVNGEEDSTTTAETPNDSNVDDSFYTLFVPAGSSVVTASMSGGYVDQVETVNITDGTTTAQDFYLDAGWLMANPTEIELTLEFGDSATVPLTLTNSGNVPASYALMVGAASEDFETAFPPADWTVVNNGGTCVWQRNDAWPNENYAGGDGFSAAADSDACGQGTTMNTELHSPALDLSAASVASLEFVASYFHLGSSSFRVHVSDDGGSSWDTLLTWTASSSAQGPGTLVSLDLTPYVGSSEVIVSFHYQAGWDWWVQVDQVRVLADVGPWLALNPSNGNIGDNSDVMVDVDVTTSNLPSPGIYTAVIAVTEDTPYMVPSIPVTLTVTASPDLAFLEGTVHSTGYCDVNSFPAAGAEVVVSSGMDSWTTYADGNGYYSLYINDSYSPVDIDVTAPNHEAGSATGVVLVGQQTTTQDFDLRLLEPCVDVASEEFDVTLTADTVATYTLTINNHGGAALNWTVDEAEGTAAGLSAASAPVVDTVSIPNNAGNAVDLVGLLGEALTFNTDSTAVTGMVVDCNAEPGILITDDGSVENGYSGNPATISQVIFVDRFTPDSYPASFSAVCVAFVSLGPSSVNFSIVLYAADGPSGQPGTLLGSLPATATGLPGGTGAPVWHSYDISSLGVSVASGDVYIGVTYAPSNPNVFIASDESTGNPVGFGGGYWWNNSAAAWATVQSTYPAYRSLMVRPVQALGGCNVPTDLPWLSVMPEMGTTAADSSDQVSVTFDTTGLMLGSTYTGTLCINSDDPMNPQVTVPVTLTIEAPEPAITLDVTVGTEAGMCGTDSAITVVEGTVVYYCYTVENTGNVTLPTHVITDTVWGHIDTFVYDLHPGMSESVVYSQTMATSVDSVATWEASHAGLGVSAMATDDVAVMVVTPGVVVDTAVDAQSGLAGSTVTYTVHITNTGDLTDTFDIALSNETWDTTAPASVTLAAGEHAMFDVVVTIAADAQADDSDSVLVTATSQMDDTVMGGVTLTTTAVEPEPTEYTSYLPIVVRP